MRLLYATHGYRPAYRVGGPVLSVAALAERLVQRGHEVTVITSNWNLDEELDVPLEVPVDVDGVRVLYFRRQEPLRWIPLFPYLTRSFGFLYAPRMRGVLERLVPDVDLVHTHMPFVYPTYAAARAARRWRKPLFYHQRGVFDRERLRFRGLKKRLYIRVVEKSTLDSATTLVALTDAEVDSYRALGVSTPCRVVPNGVDVERYRTQPQSDPLAPWGVAPDATVLLFLGRVHPIKGADLLLEAFLRVARAVPDAVLVVAGPDEWGLERRFQEAAAAEGMARRVIFPGMVSGDLKLDLLARADVFALPSQAEGFSMAVLEALASGTGVLLSPGCHFERVQEAGAGLVVPNTVPALADALAQLLPRRDRLQALGQAGYKLVQEEYGWDVITDRIQETYEEGVGRYRARR